MIQYSASRFKCFLDCPFNYKLSYVDKIYLPRPVTSDTEFGKLIHKMAEIYNGSNEIELVKLIKNYQLDAKYKKYIAPALNNFFKFYAKYGAFEYVAEKSYTLQNQDYKLNGVIDRLITKPNELIVVDYKTSATADKERHLFQMRLYNLMISKLYNREPESIKALVYYPRIHQEDEFLFMNAEMELFDKSIKELIVKIETNKVWTPSPGYQCKWCAYNGKQCKMGIK